MLHVTSLTHRERRDSWTRQSSCEQRMDRPSDLIHAEIRAGVYMSRVEISHCSAKTIQRCANHDARAGCSTKAAVVSGCPEPVRAREQEPQPCEPLLDSATLHNPSHLYVRTWRLDSPSRPGVSALCTRAEKAAGVKSLVIFGSSCS
jgi:hypothetical protein